MNRDYLEVKRQLNIALAALRKIKKEAQPKFQPGMMFYDIAQSALRRMGKG